MKYKKNLIKLIELPTVCDDGYITFGQSPSIPFEIKRFYFIYNCVPGLLRGKHAHRKTKQILFCLKGSVRMIMDNGINKKEVILDKPHVGIFIDKMVWHDMCDIKKDTLMLVIASEKYKPEDYIRNYEFFLELTKK